MDDCRLATDWRRYRVRLYSFPMKGSAIIFLSSNLSRIWHHDALDQISKDCIMLHVSPVTDNWQGRDNINCWWLPVYQSPSTQPHSYRARPLKLSDLAIGVRSTGYQVGWIILKKMAWLTIRKGTHCSLHIFHLYCIMESGWWYLIHDESCMRYVVYCCSMKVWLNYLSLNQCKFAVKSGTIIK